MVRQFLILAGLAVGVSVSADVKPVVSTSMNPMDQAMRLKRSEVSVAKAYLNDGSNTREAQKAAGRSVQWKRPAGQFWGTGYSAEDNQLGYYYTPLVLRPWTDYTFENISTVSSGSPSWDVQYFDVNKGEYVIDTFADQNLTWSYIHGEMGSAPLLSYKSQVPYPSQYYGKNLTDLKSLPLCIGKDIASIWQMGVMPVSSHYWSLFARNSGSGAGITSYYGAKAYEGEDKDNGWWFGTNAGGYNAMATRFEKPDQPYLLNSVYWYYQFDGTIVENIPVKAYVFKTVNDALEQTVPSSQGGEVVIETLELGELIATSESFILAATADDDNFQNAVKFEFKEVNPVTGAESAVSLEIDDDITIVVVGYDAFPGKGACVRTCMSTDEYDEGYGNLGFLGSFEEAEDGTISYGLTSLTTFFANPLPNTTLGVLADVTYPWLQEYYVEQPNDIQLPNSGETTEEVQGLQYVLALMSTSPTDDFDVTFNGEDECDWLEIVGVYDEMEENEQGVEEFTGLTALEFEAAPNPEDIDRTCVVKISIPAASYVITFRQGSNNAVDAVVVESGAAKYYDLAGRQVANPDKGIYIRKIGNKTEKVVL